MSEKTTTATGDRLLSLRETARILQCGKTRVVRLVTAKELIAEERTDPVTKSKRYLFDHAEILAYRQRCRTFQPAPEDVKRSSRVIEHAW